jgi:hypothetical protein
MPMRTSHCYHAALLLLALVGPASADPGNRSSDRLGLRSGEAFTFRFSVGPVESGRARMSVGFPVEKNGRRLLAVHGQAETLPWLSIVARMNDDYRLLLDADTLLPVEIVSTEQGMRERRIETVVTGRMVDISLSSKKESGKTRGRLPGDARDPLSALFAVRAAPLADGDTLEMLIVDGMALWRSRMQVRRERVRLENDEHSRAAVRLDGENQRLDGAGKPAPQPPRHYTVWLSDDAARVLLRMEADTDLGRAALELTSYQVAR